MTDKISEDIDKLTDLSLSVGRQGRDKKNVPRPLTPIEVATYIQQWKDETNQTDSEISKRLGLGKPKTKEVRMEDIHVEEPKGDQVKTFLKLLKISDKSINLIGWNGDSGKCVFSTAVLVANHSEDTQNTVIHNIIKEKLSRDEVRRSLQYMKKYELSIKDSIEKTTNRRVETYDQYGVAYNIPNSVSKKLMTFGKTNDEICEKLSTFIDKKLTGQIDGITIREHFMIINMDDVAYKSFLDRIKTKNLNYNKCIQDLIMGD